MQCFIYHLGSHYIRTWTTFIELCSELTRVETGARNIYLTINNQASTVKLDGLVFLVNLVSRGGRHVTRWRWFKRIVHFPFSSWGLCTFVAKMRSVNLFGGNQTKLAWLQKLLRSFHLYVVLRRPHISYILTQLYKCDQSWSYSIHFECNFECNFECGAVLVSIKDMPPSWDK